MLEINEPCELCACNWRHGCDVDFTRRYINPRIPPRCPRGYAPTQHFNDELEREIEATSNLLDKRILALLVYRETRAKGNGYKWIGLTVKEIAKLLGMKKGRYVAMETTGKIKRALGTLKMQGRIYSIKNSKKHRYFSSSHIMFVAGAFPKYEQLFLDEFFLGGRCP